MVMYILETGKDWGCMGLYSLVNYVHNSGVGGTWCTRYYYTKDKSINLV